MKRNPLVRGVIDLSTLGLLGLGFLVACGGGASQGVTSDAGAGQKLYGSNCALCHGQGGVGKPALGKDLRGNEFIGGLTDDQVVEFLREGRRADHPLNERGVDMPPKGGNPGLSDDDLRRIVAYLRSLS